MTRRDDDFRRERIRLDALWNEGPAVEGRYIVIPDQTGDVWTLVDTQEDLIREYDNEEQALYFAARFGAQDRALADPVFIAERAAEVEKERVANEEKERVLELARRRTESARQEEERVAEEALEAHIRELEVRYPAYSKPPLSIGDVWAYVWRAAVAWFIIYLLFAAATQLKCGGSGIVACWW